MNYQLRIKEATDHWEEDLAYLIRLSNAKLEKKLDIIRQQMVIAEKNKQDEALQLLRIWEVRTIEARIRKEEQCPDLDEKSEIEIELTAMEEMEAELERRQRILEKTTQAITEGEPEIKMEYPVREEQKKPDQLKLF